MLLGDRIEQITTATGIKTVVEKVAKAANKDCGCSKRKQTLNNPDLLINKILNHPDSLDTEEQKINQGIIDSSI